MPPLNPRYVPPSVYIHGAKLSAKLIILLTILAVVSTLFTSCLCYLCIKRRRRNRRIRLQRQREREEMENKQLRPRINGRNARFYA
ncbi:hypothetical protein IFR05_017098, partial [Cadophora sp. M221]